MNYRVLFAIGLAMLPTVSAQCTQWDASGQWNIEVTSGPRKRAVAHVNFRQTGKNLSGKVTNEGLGGVGTVSNGSSDGDTFNVYLLWDVKDAEGSNVEIYPGKIADNGMIAGTATLFGDRSRNAAWSSDRSMKCLVGSITSTQKAPTPRPNKRSGKRPPTTLPPAPPKPPFIIAGQAIIPTPNHPFGSVYLGWDGGPDYPNVEVWVSINNEAEIPAFSLDYPPQHPVFKQPKVTGIELKLQRRTSYKLVLKAAGKTLSTAVFVVP